MKKCQYCAEEIQDEAIKCRYCQSDLNADVEIGVADEKEYIAEMNASKDNVVQILLAYENTRQQIQKDMFGGLFAMAYLFSSSESMNIGLDGEIAQLQNYASLLSQNYSLVAALTVPVNHNKNHSLYLVSLQKIAEGIENIANGICSGNSTEKVIGAEMISGGQDIFLQAVQGLGLVDA